MRAFAITGIVTASWISLITLGLAIRATPPAARMSAGTRSSAITATAPASSEIRACSAVVTSMITPPLSISARPRLTRNVALSAIDPKYTGSSSGDDGLFQLEGADAVFERRLVARVDAVGERLDDSQQGRVGARERGAVRGVIERQLGVLADLGERGVADRERAGAAVPGQLHRPDHQRVGATGGERDHQRVLVDPAEPRDRVLARAGDHLGADVEQGQEVTQVAGEEGHLVDANDHHPVRRAQGGHARLDLLAGEVASRVLDVSVVGGQRRLELGVVEVEQLAGAVLLRRSVAVLLDRRLLKLGITLEPERLREADHGRGRGVGAAGQLLGGLEGGLVEVIDDVAGNILLRAGELVEALG